MFMKKSTHRKLYVKQGETYRKALQEKDWEISKLKQQLNTYFDNMIPYMEVGNDVLPYNNWRLIIEIDARHLREKLPQELLQMLAQRILERLHGFNKDFRPDLREQTKNARLLIK